MPYDYFMTSLIETQPGRLPEVRVRPSKLSEHDADGAADRLAQGTIGKKRGWPKGKPRVRKTKLAVLGIPSGVLDRGSPSYARCVRLASAYRKVRVRELTISHGFVSSGSSALLASAAHALAASRYLYEKAAEATGADMLELLKVASRLADSARANELAAWELSAREGVARRRNATADNGMPWVVSNEELKKKRGRPRKDAETAMILPAVGTDLTSWVQDAKIESEVVDESGAGSGTESQDGPSQGGDDN